MMKVVEKRMEARREKVRKLHAEDLQIAVIADLLGVSQPTIYKDLMFMGLRKKGECPKNGKYSREQRDAISRGIKKKYARALMDSKVKPLCCVCGKPADRRPYRKDLYCGEHLITAGDHDPNHLEKERAAAGDRFASPGKTGDNW